MFCCFVFFDLFARVLFFLFLYQVFSVLFVCLFVCVSQAVAVSAVGPSLGMAPKLLAQKIEGYVLLMFYWCFIDVLLMFSKKKITPSLVIFWVRVRLCEELLHLGWLAQAGWWKALVPLDGAGGQWSPSPTDPLDGWWMGCLMGCLMVYYMGWFMVYYMRYDMVWLAHKPSIPSHHKPCSTPILWDSVYYHYYR